MAVEPATGRLKLALSSLKKLQQAQDQGKEGGEDGGHGFKPGDLAFAIVKKVVSQKEGAAAAAPSPAAAAAATAAFATSQGSPRTYYIVSLSSSHRSEEDEAGGSKGREVLARLEAFHLSDHQGALGLMLRYTTLACFTPDQDKPLSLLLPCLLTFRPPACRRRRGSLVSGEGGEPYWTSPHSRSSLPALQ